MATIPSGTKFLGVDPNFTDLTERKGTNVDRKSEYFSLEDIVAAVGPTGPQGPSGVLAYKEFSGRIFQESISNPITLTVFKNDFNELPTVSNDFGSPYDFVISLTNEFTLNKTSVKTNVERNNIIVSYPAADNSTIYFNSFDFAGEQAAPISFTFEIRVYN